MQTNIKAEQIKGLKMKIQERHFEVQQVGGFFSQQASWWISWGWGPKKRRPNTSRTLRLRVWNKLNWWVDWLAAFVSTKEDIKEQPTSRNLSATATRVLQCTCPVAASQKYFSAIHTSPHLTSTHLTLAFVNNILLHLLLVLCTAVNVRNKS